MSDIHSSGFLLYVSWLRLYLFVISLDKKDLIRVMSLSLSGQEMSLMLPKEQRHPCFIWETSGGKYENDFMKVFCLGTTQIRPSGNINTASNASEE